MNETRPCAECRGPITKKPGVGRWPLTCSEACKARRKYKPPGAKARPAREAREADAIAKAIEAYEGAKELVATLKERLKVAEDDMEAAEERVELARRTVFNRAGIIGRMQ